MQLNTENQINTAPQTANALSEATAAAIFATFFRIGLFTLGGGLAMSTVIRHELVLSRKWVRDEDFLAELSTATMVPGAIAVNIAYLQGRRLRGPFGSLAAVSGTILPSFIIILLVALFAMPWFANPRVEAFLHGCAVAVAGQLAFAGFVFARKRLRRPANMLICAVGVFLAGYLGLHPVLAVFSVGIAGYFFGCPVEPESASAEEANQIKTESES